MNRRKKRDTSKETIIKKSDMIMNRIMSEFETEFNLLFKTVLILGMKTIRKRADLDEKMKNRFEREREKRPIDKEIAQHSELAVAIVDFEIADYDSDDPFLIYAVKSSYGNIESLVYKRYDQFKQLGTQIGKYSRIPHPSAGYLGLGKKKMSMNFAKKRMKLLHCYLVEIISNPKKAKNPYLLKWLGYGNDKDMLIYNVFEMAFSNTKSIYGRIYFDDPVEALVKRISTEIIRELYSNNKKKAEKVSNELMDRYLHDIENRWARMRRNAEGYKIEIGEEVTQVELFDREKELEEELVKIFQKESGPLGEQFNESVAYVLETFLPLVKNIIETLSAKSIPLLGKLKKKIVNDITIEDIKKIEEHFSYIFDGLVMNSKELAEIVTDKLRKPKNCPPIINIFYTLTSYLNDLLLILIEYSNFHYLFNILIGVVEMRNSLLSGYQEMDMRQKINQVEEHIQEIIWRAKRDWNFTVWKLQYSFMKKLEMEDENNDGSKPDSMSMSPVIAGIRHFLNEMTGMIIGLAEEFIDNFGNHLEEKLVKRNLTLEDKSFLEPLLNEGISKSMDKFLVSLQKEFKIILTRNIPILFADFVVIAIYNSYLPRIKTHFSFLSIPKQFAQILDPSVIFRLAIRNYLAKCIQSTVRNWIKIIYGKVQDLDPIRSKSVEMNKRRKYTLHVELGSSTQLKKEESGAESLKKNLSKKKIDFSADSKSRYISESDTTKSNTTFSTTRKISQTPLSHSSSSSSSSVSSTASSCASPPTSTSTSSASSTTSTSSTSTITTSSSSSSSSPSVPSSRTKEDKSSESGAESSSSSNSSGSLLNIDKFINPSTQSKTNSTIPSSENGTNIKILSSNRESDNDQLSSETESETSSSKN